MTLIPKITIEYPSFTSLITQEQILPKGSLKREGKCSCMIPTYGVHRKGISGMLFKIISLQVYSGL